MNSQWKAYLLVALGSIILCATVAIVAPHVSAGRAAFAAAAPEPQDPDAGQPFQRSISVTLSSGVDAGSSLLSLPADKRLVIEEITIEGRTPAGDMLARINLNSGGCGGCVHRLALTPQGTFSGKRVFMGTHLVRLYANAGSTIQVFAFRNDTTGTLSMSFHVSGYLRNS
jgi:hypothetical protein